VAHSTALAREHGASPYGRPPAGSNGAPTLEDTPLVRGNLSFHDITELVAHHTEKKTPTGWFFAFSLALLGRGVLGRGLSYLVWNGTGPRGLNNPCGGSVSATRARSSRRSSSCSGSGGARASTAPPRR
jgi:molybdopterin-containing oxidoreductase family membrane subunit